MKKYIAALLLAFLVSTQATAQEMKIVYYDSYPPRSWLEQGRMKGILVDIITEAAERRAGIPLSHEGYPWARVQAMVEKGLADAFITVPTVKRKTYSLPGEVPVIRFNLYIATQRDNPRLEQLKKVSSIDELLPYTIVDYLGNGFAKTRLKGFDVEWVNAVEATYPFLAHGRADVLLISNRGISDLKRLGYLEKLTVLPQTMRSLEFHLCISKKSPLKNTLPEIDKALEQMRSEGVIDTILRKYYE